MDAKCRLVCALKRTDGSKNENIRKDKRNKGSGKRMEEAGTYGRACADHGLFA